MLTYSISECFPSLFAPLRLVRPLSSLCGIPRRRLEAKRTALRAVCKEPPGLRCARRSGRHCGQPLGHPHPAIGFA
eukprot:15483043-Alexandrium_andersonii.AAC.1